MMFQRVRQKLLGLRPERSRGRIAEYDQGRGFDDYAAACRAVAQIEAADAASIAAAEEALHDAGVTSLDVLTATRAAALREQLIGLPARPPRIGEIDYSDTFDVPAALEREIVHAILDTPVVRVIERHFGSHFLLYTWHATRLQPRVAPKRSMLWHCDSGPTQHLKLIVYLEDSSATGGNTAFLDRSTSDLFLDKGYTFGPVRHRRDDLTGLARRLDIPFEPKTWDIEAGQGVLFEPARVLHRGVIPSRAPRHVVTLLLLPSTRPWAEIYAAQGLVASAFGPGFPAQARDLLHKI